MISTPIRKLWAAVASVLLLSPAVGCRDEAKISEAKAVEHVVELRTTIENDVLEVRDGLPRGAEKLAELWSQKEGVPGSDPSEMRLALDRARNSVQLLRVAKSTFFALANREGVVLRNDQDQDLMAGKSLFAPFPGLQKAAAGQYAETLGRMDAANGVAGKPDGQWIAAEPISVAGGTVGLYVTGWAWSAYAYRLEFAIRSSIRSAIARSSDQTKEPLTYVFLIVGQSVFCAPQTPQIDADAISKLKPMEHLGGAQPFSTVLNLTERDFGFAAVKAPALGDNVAVGVLRSET